MEPVVRLFTAQSVLTMLHGIVLGGGALLGLAAALFYLGATPAGEALAAPRQARLLATLLVLTTVALWLAVWVGTYVNFPPYRATPPEGLADLREYPRSLLLASPATAWLHAFAMEIKEHVPWAAAMISTAVAFVATRRDAPLLRDPALRRSAVGLLTIAFFMVAAAALLGTFVNKIAPLD